MNDITALAEREKFEAWAEKSWRVAVGRLKNQRNTSGGYSLQVYTHMWKAWQAANAEMVEALEKAQQQKESDFEIKARLCKESNGLHDRLREAEKRIAELESRTVTVNLPAEYLNADGSVNADMANTCPVVSAYREAHRAAGIQVIEGEGQ